MLKKLRLLKYLILLLGTSIWCQEVPPFANYNPSMYGAENQNWNIAQTQNLNIYAANNKGLLEYNGARWKCYPSPQGIKLRALKVVGSRIYSGGFREFGYWQPNDFGQLIYYSLSSEHQQQLLEDEEIWSIEWVEGVLLFQSKKRIYFYDVQTQSLTWVSAYNVLPRIFNLKKGIYFQESKGGLFQLRNGKKKLVSAAYPFVEDEIIQMVQQQEKLLVITQKNGIYSLSDNELVPWITEIDDLFINLSIYSAIQTQSGYLALGTISHGLFLLDASGQLMYQLDQNNGLANNTVLCLFEDEQANLWLGLDKGISLINQNAPFQIFNDYLGTIGSVYAVAMYRDVLYLGTNQGLYRRFKNQKRFELVKGSEGQVWSLSVIGPHLFCGHHKGTLIIDGEQLDWLNEVAGTWAVKLVKFKEESFYLQGNYDGLYVLENKNNKWQIGNKIEGFDNSSRHFEFFDSTLVVNHEYKGLFFLTVDDYFKKVISQTQDSISTSLNSHILYFEDELYYANATGIYRKPSKHKAFKKDSILSSVYKDFGYVSGKLSSDTKNGNLWLFAQDAVVMASRGKLTSEFVKHILPLDEYARGTIDGYESLLELEDKKYLLGTSTGYLMVDNSAFKPKEFKIGISEIGKLSKSEPGKVESLLSVLKPTTLEHNKNGLKFDVHLPNYSVFEKPKYQYWLEGFYPEWGAWTDKSSITFENLPTGDYILHARAKLGNTLSTNIITHKFSVSPPWYLSWWAYILYTLLLVILGIIIHFNYRRYYHKQQAKLKERNEKDLRVARIENEKKITELKNEQLRKEFKSKSNELAASTLSLLRKNELLTKVKNELLSNGARREIVMPIIEVIDKDLNKADDWDMFKEAFDNADQKFLKKLKKSHPNLTPNDIKLCAYLRLNLSSKEIAPLLNISPRSVEIKRYRLRKKMNLEHDDNLTDYILGL